jgi:hypothetical protein
VLPPATVMSICRRYRGPSRGRETCFRICRNREQNVAGVAADGEYGGRVGANGYAHIAENLRDLIELR